MYGTSHNIAINWILSLSKQLCYQIFCGKSTHNQKNLSIRAFDPKNGKEIGIVSSNFNYFDPGSLIQLKVFFINFHK